MPNSQFNPVYGIIQNIRQTGQCCHQTATVITQNGIVTLTISPETFVADGVQLRAGLPIFAFYDVNAPVPLIFPPQYQAVVIGRRPMNESVMLDYFGTDLLNAEGTLRLNLGSSTDIVTSNGQRVSCNVGGQLLLVYYSTTTRSIPAQTTPRRIIVICR